MTAVVSIYRARVLYQEERVLEIEARTIEEARWMLEDGLGDTIEAYTIIRDYEVEKVWDTGLTVEVDDYVPYDE